MPSDFRRYRTFYARLLRLYPKAFQSRFGEGMAQTFRDMCVERRTAGRGLFRFALSTYFETLFAAIRENFTHMTHNSTILIRVGLVSLGLLMVPLIASRLVDRWNWPPRAFVLVYGLFFATGLAYSWISARMPSIAYKAGVGISLAAALALAWSNMVHVADSGNPANLLYYSVLGVGLVGAILARLRPAGLARTLFAMAATLLLIAVLLPSGAPFPLSRNMAVGHGIVVALFTASGLLFRHAGLAKST